MSAVVTDLLALGGFLGAPALVTAGCAIKGWPVPVSELHKITNDWNGIPKYLRWTHQTRFLEQTVMKWGTRTFPLVAGVGIFLGTLAAWYALKPGIVKRDSDNWRSLLGGGLATGIYAAFFHGTTSVMAGCISPNIPFLRGYGYTLLLIGIGLFNQTSFPPSQDFR